MNFSKTTKLGTGRARIENRSISSKDYAYKLEPRRLFFPKPRVLLKAYK
jgi:hypothetical protein